MCHVVRRSRRASELMQVRSCFTDWEKWRCRCGSKAYLGGITMHETAVTPAYTRCVNLAMPQFKGVEMSTFGFSSEGVVDIQLRHHAGEVGMHGAVPGA